MFIKIFLIGFLFNVVASQAVPEFFMFTSQPDGRLTQLAIVNSPANWYKASQTCAQNGYYLASITSIELQNAIRTHLVDSGSYTNDVFWIGGNDDAMEGQFYWEQGEPLTFTNWKTASPNNGAMGNCIVLLSGTDDFKWDDEDCVHQHKYICEKPIPSLSIENSQIISSLQTAQTYVILSDKLDYPTAEDYCQINGMKLISNSDETENLVIQQILVQVGIPAEQVWLSVQDECNQQDLSFFAYNNCTKAEFSQSGQILLLNNALCIEQHYVICEKSFFEVY